MLRRGGEPVRLEHRQRRVRPRRLVLVVDVSGSMQPYADPYLRFAHAAARRRPGTEVFTIGTRLTRVTREMRGPRPVGRAARGGRRGARLERRHPARRAAQGVPRPVGPARRRPAVPSSWSRPTAGSAATPTCSASRWRGCTGSRTAWSGSTRTAGLPGYAPMTAGMLAALPHVDDFVDGHTLRRAANGSPLVISRRHAVHDVARRRRPRWYDGGERFALATVVGTWRSAPRQPGAAMVVAARRRAGGQRLAAAASRARSTSSARRCWRPASRCCSATASATTTRSRSGLTCGGIIDIFVEPVDATTFPELADVVGVDARRTSRSPSRR